MYTIALHGYTYLLAPLMYHIIRLFSLGANFPEFPKQPCNLGNLCQPSCFYSSITDYKRVLAYVNPQLSTYQLSFINLFYKEAM